MDEDTINTVNAENYQQYKEERDVKNKILSMTNEDRKQELWNKWFAPISLPDDSYLSGNLF
jgi:hypothetical protein